MKTNLERSISIFMILISLGLLIFSFYLLIFGVHEAIVGELSFYGFFFILCLLLLVVLIEGYSLFVFANDIKSKKIYNPLTKKYYPAEELSPKENVKGLWSGKKNKKWKW